MKLLSMFLLLLIVPAFAQGGQPAAKETPKATYARILAQINDNKPDVDWTALRFAAARGGAGEDEHEPDLRKKMFAALSDKRYSDALAAAQQIVSRDMANGDAHYVEMVAYGETNKKAQSEAEGEKVMALVHSIMGGKHGKSADDAWVTVNVDEEYFVLRSLGMRPKEQALSTVGGRYYDVMTVTDGHDAGHEYTYWFDTNFAMDAMADADAMKDSEKSK